MKYKLLRFSLVGIFAMLWGSVFAQAPDETITFSELGYDNAEQVTTVEGTDVTLTLDKGPSTAPAYYNTGTALRLYNRNTMTVTSATKTIEKVVFTFSGTYTFSALKNQNTSFSTGKYEESGSTGTWTGSTDEFTVTAGATSGHARIQKMEFYYAAGGETDTRQATTLTFGEHQTTGIVNESMDCPTVTITAADGAPVQYDYIDWSSSDETVAGIADGNIGFLKTGTTTIKASFAGDNTYKPCSASFTLTVTAAPYTSIAAMLADITSTRTSATYKFENLLVTYVSGSNTYVSDGENGFLFYGSDLGLVKGYTYSGTVTGQLYTYNGLPEMALSTSDISAQMQTENNDIPVVTIVPADLQDNVNVLVSIEDAEFVAAGTGGKNLTFKVGDEEFVVYNQWSINTDALEAGKIYSLNGVGSIYKENYQLYLISFKETGQSEDTRTDLGLSFPQQAYEATIGETFTAPELSGVIADFDGSIVYSSSNGEVATVTVDGEVTLVAPGTTTITADAEFSNLYKGSASYTLTVKEGQQTPVEVGDLIYTKVTSADQLVDGAEYLIVYEEGSVAFNGALETIDAVENTVAVTIREGKIAQADDVDAATFTIAKAVGAEGYTVYAPASKKYIGVSSYTNGLKATDDAVIHAISFDDDGNAVMTVTTDGGDMTLRFNATTGQMRFRYYKQGQQPVALYKKAAGEEPQPAEWAWADFAVQLTNTEVFDTSVNNFGVKVAQDGSYTATTADDKTANFTVSAVRFNGADHGWVNCTFTMRVDGPVLIKLGDCQFGDQSGTITDAEGNVTEIKANATKACWHNDKENNVVSVYYRGLEPTTLTIKYDGYCPFISAQAVDPADLPAETQQFTVTFSAGDSGAEGVVPAAITDEEGTEITIPQNFTLYKEGMTLTAWADASGASYAPGEKVALASDMTLVPVFSQNEWTLGEQQEPVTVKWNFRRDAGAPSVQWQNQDNLVWVAQATADGKTIDVAARFSTNPGKFNNASWTDWCQINPGTTFTIPSANGAVVSVEAYNALSELTIDGQNDYTSAKTVSYTVQSGDQTIDVVFGNEGQYYRYLQVVLPKAEKQLSGLSFDNVEGTISWQVGNEESGTVSEDIADAVQSALWSAGSEMTITTSTYFESTMVNYKPNNSNAGDVEGVMIEYRVKMAAGLTFKPTSVSYDCVKVGTDGATYSWGYAVDDVASATTKVDAATTLRNNGSNSATAQLNHTLDMSNAGEGNVFAMRFYISSTANNKNICIGNVKINGVVNGTIEDVVTYTFAASAAPEEAGSVSVYPAGDTFEEGTELKLKATENFGYDFVSWTNAEGTVVSEEPEFTYTVSADAVLTANFQAVETYELALTVDGTNDYMVTIAPAPTMVDGKMMYEAGAAVQLNARQYEGLVTFTNWSDGETSSSKLVKMDADVDITAMYAQADIIAGWDFYTRGSSGRKADFYAQDNDGDALNLVNTETGETSGWLDKSTEADGGYESFDGAAVNWRTGSQDGDVGNWHWQTKVNAEAFTDINVQFQMLYNYNAYQTYLAEYSLDGESWTKFGSVTMSGTRVVAALNEQLPAEANNQAELYIRMRADKENSSVDGTSSKNDGNALAMFFITGTPKLVDDGTAPVLVASVPATGATGVSASGKVVLTFDERVQLATSFMPTATLGSQTLKPAVSGKTVTFEYKGLEYNTEYTFTLPGGSIGDLTGNFLQDDVTLTFTTMARPTVEKKLYDFIVPDDGTFAEALKAAEARADKNVRYRIFVKQGSHVIAANTAALVDGTDGKQYADPKTYFSSPNVSIIGEDPATTSVTNEMPATASGTANPLEGIRTSGVLYLQSGATDTYFQDIKLWSATADNTGRNVVLVDGGNRTVCKNVTLWAYQDTYVSDNTRNLYYFEGGLLRGRTDFLCGSGDVFYNGVTLQMCQDGGYIAVPRANVQYGYVFKDCTIKGENSKVDGNYYLGRPWTEAAEVYFIDTKMEVVPRAIGWAEMSDGGCTRMAEYNSMTATGSAVDLSSRAKSLGKTTANPNNPVLTAEEALEIGNLHNMFGDWDPTLLTEQAPIPANVSLNKDTNVLTWDDSNYALLYAIVKGGKVIDFTLSNTYTVDDATASYNVRAANEMGGLSEASETAAITTAITEVANGEQAVPQTVYNINGIRVEKAQKGLYIVNGKKVVVK